MLRIDDHQRFSCSQCGRCCRRFDVVVTAAEIDLYRKRNAVAWFRREDGVADPFVPIEGTAFHRIRQRADGTCGFLSDDNRCRIHEQLGADSKPLTCRLFPFSLHPSGDNVIAVASFRCPTVVANTGRLVASGESLVALESLRKQWFDVHDGIDMPTRLVAGRSVDARSASILRDSLLAMLGHPSADIRDNIRRVAAALDDLTRRRVLALSEDDFAEYVSLTLPYAANKADAPAPRPPSWNGKLLQHGFLFAVVAIREGIENAEQSRAQLRATRLKLLAHFHGIGPKVGRVDLGAIKRVPVDINSPELRPLVFHYLRSTITTLGSTGRPLVDELNLAASFLNAAIALAQMNAASSTAVTRDVFISAITEASDVAHTNGAFLDWALPRLTGGTEALWALANRAAVGN